MKEFRPRDFQPGDYDTVDELMMEVRANFCEWIQARYKLSDRYAEETLMETNLAFRDLVDLGMISGSDKSPVANFYALGAQVGRNLCSRVQGHFKLHPPTAEEMAAADAAHGVKLHAIPNPHRFPALPHKKVATKIDEVMDLLNPESQKLCRHLSRTAVGREELAKALKYGTAEGLAMVEDDCMERLTDTVSQVFGDSYELNPDFRANKEFVEQLYGTYMAEQKAPLLEKIREVELMKRGAVTGQIVAKIGVLVGIALIVTALLILLNNL